jgi:hypothetical protein
VIIAKSTQTILFYGFAAFAVAGLIASIVLTRRGKTSRAVTAFTVVLFVLGAAGALGVRFLGRDVITVSGNRTLEAERTVELFHASGSTRIVNESDHTLRIEYFLYSRYPQPLGAPRDEPTLVPPRSELVFPHEIPHVGPGVMPPDNVESDETEERRYYLTW